MPEPRRLATCTDVQVLELAASLKRENPSHTAAQVARILRTATGWAPSESTLLRHFHRCELMGPTAGQSNEVFGRFEAADPNELWVGDALCRTRHNASYADLAVMPHRVEGIKQQPIRGNQSA
nr:hypothetical protein [Mycolicibacterium xanthum]